LLMVEGGATEEPESGILEAFTVALAEIKKICQAQEDLAKGIKKPTMAWTPVEIPAELKKAVDELSRPGIKEAVRIADKATRDGKVSAIKKMLKEKLLETYPGTEAKISLALENVQ